MAYLAAYILVGFIISAIAARMLGNPYSNDNSDEIVAAVIIGILWLFFVPVYIAYKFYEWVIYL